ncbi:DUF2007 domain-containing protein [Evansella tamaricis]|uniref:DUF2007 domain-containing protein n=1 Tax=Evansella tamaricis TaxID=2069301 RepID=A0ABS6JDE3_9BACI|nr:DUF2007 domain-containing protein [Evansella tamaricis]MBU9711219.1 DUF2007 domain-containing protein [Evansella tamaricis]
MPWCPNCHEEYIDHMKICKDCNVDLNDGEPPEEDPQRLEFVDTEFLTTASSEIEANMLEAMLETNHIATVKNYREAGGYLAIYMGETSYGIDLYVDKEKLETARELLAQLETSPVLAEDEEETSSNESVKKSKGLRVAFVIFIILLFVIVQGLAFL